jgi:U3 small nucleolar RNA-associated protein 10
MVSSLAAQLAQGASLNAAILTDRARRKPTESYLFSGRDGDRHDLESIHALGANGLHQLRTLDRRIGAFEDILFSDSAKRLDRTLQNKDMNEKLDADIAQLLGLLGPFILEAPTGKVLEWLVRRFRCVRSLSL